MRARPLERPTELAEALALACDPAVTPRQHAELRRRVAGACGPAADDVLRFCDHAASITRERDRLAEELDRFLAGPRLRAVVTGVSDDRVRVVVGGVERDLVRPAGMTLAVGHTALTDFEGRAILAPGDELVGGRTFALCEQLDGSSVLLRPLGEGASGEARQLGLVSAAVDLAGLAPGDRVLGWSLDAGNLVLVTRHLGPPRPAVADDGRPPQSIARRDLVGLDDVLDRIELLFLAPESPAYTRLLDVVQGSLVGYCLQGPTGCGKTRVAQLFAAEVRRRGGLAIERTASDYLSKWVGEGAERLRADFCALDAHWDETGVRPLLVIDEIEAIALDRRQGPGSNTPGYIDVLDTLLHYLTRTSARVLGISNVADRLVDSALQRDGRLPLLAFPATLKAPEVADLVARRLAGVPLDGGTPGDFGALVSDVVFSPGGPLAELLRAQLSDGRVLTFGAASLVSGAAIADGVVHPTIARGLQRDLRDGRPEPRPLRAEDLHEATVGYFRGRAAAITRDSIRAVLGAQLPDDLAVVRVDTHTGRT